MGLSKYFKKPITEKTINIQVRLPCRLVKELKPFMKSNKLSWKDMFTGSLMALRDETMKGKK